MLTTLAAALLAAIPGSLTATVNDPMSHGTLGDSLLSIDEAIRLANGTLTVAMLSAGEAAQVQGGGSMVDRIVVDAMITPSITLESPLTPVTGSMMGMLTIEGMSMSSPTGMVMPLLHGGSHAHVLALRTPMVQVMGLHIDGGQVGIDARIANGTMLPGGMAMVMHCDLHQQTSAGIHVAASGAESTTLMVMHTHFHNMARGIFVDEQSTSGLTMVELEHVHMDNVVLGAEVLEASMGNRMSMLMFFRCGFMGGTTFLQMRRPNTSSTQQFMIRVVHCDIMTTGDAIDVQGVAGGTTMVHHHHSDILAPGMRALRVWPRTADFDFHGSENLIEGDVEIAASLFTQRLWQQNNVFRNGTITVDSDGSVPNFLWNRYENCTIRVPSTARAPVRVRTSELVNTTCEGLSLAAPITLQGCWRSGGALNGQASETSPAPSRFLGSATVSPEEPALGSSVAITADLPYGVGCFWHFAVAEPRPNTTAEPIRFYGDPFSAVLLPGMVVFQSRIDVPVPNDTNLVGLEFYVQPVTVPLLQQPWIPAFHLPRGGLLRPVL